MRLFIWLSVTFETIHFILYRLSSQLNFEEIVQKKYTKTDIAWRLCVRYILYIYSYIIHTPYTYISFCLYFFEKWIHKVEENGIWNWRYDKTALCYKSCSRDIGSICLKNRWFFGVKCRGKFKLIPLFLFFLSLSLSAFLLFCYFYFTWER